MGDTVCKYGHRYTWFSPCATACCGCCGCCCCCLAAPPFVPSLASTRRIPPVFFLTVCGFFHLLFPFFSFALVCLNDPCSFPPPPPLAPGLCAGGSLTMLARQLARRAVTLNAPRAMLSTAITPNAPTATAFNLPFGGDKAGVVRFRLRLPPFVRAAVLTNSTHTHRSAQSTAAATPSRSSPATALAVR